MYSQFCRNLKNYIRINSHTNSDSSLRLQIAKDILFLADVEAYKVYKKYNDPLYTKIGEFIYILSKYKNKYPSLERFIWELWAYGFDIIETKTVKHHKIKHIDEKVKLIDLLLSTHYLPG